jgi:hypothetical protein
MAAMMLVMVMPAMANNPPNCEHGQLKALDNAQERGDREQAAKHFNKFTDCVRGQSPGEGHN